MLAAADYENGAPPPDLSLALSCRRWNSLPLSGGLLDQPAGLMRRLAIVENIYNAFRSMKQADDLGEWGDKNPDALGIVDSIYALRKVQDDKADSSSITGGDHGG